MNVQGQIKVKDLIKNTFFHSSGIFIGKILNFALKIVSLKILGLENLGIYILLNLLIPYYSYFFLGLSYSLPRLIPKLQAKKDFEAIQKNRSVVNLFNLFMSILLMAIFFVYIVFFYDKQNFGFTKISLIIVFLTSFFTQIATLINSHLKSIGEFTKKTVNSAAVRIFFPIVSMILIFFFGLNGYLLSGLLINAINSINLILFSQRKNLNIFDIGFFDFGLLIQNIKLGFSMLIGKKFSDILYTILMTFIGFNFSKFIVGEIGFLMSMFSAISQLLGPFYLVVERRIYLLKELSKIKVNDFLNISFGNSIALGIMIQSFSLIMVYIIPIYFTELNQSIILIPLLAMLFTLKNSIMINDFYINAYNLLKKRNIIAILITGLYFLGTRESFIIIDIKYFLIIYMICIFIYKILLHLFLINFFKDPLTIFRIILGDLLSTVIVFLFCSMIVHNDFKIYESIGLLIIFLISLVFVYLKNPVRLSKNLIQFLDKDLVK